MNHKIENEFLRVEANSSGAELMSVFSKTANKELLWQGDKQWWPRKAPALFPIVGKLKNDTYSLEGNQYQLSQHGFARDKNFTLIGSDEQKLVYALESDNDTLQKYPFTFRLTITYELKERVLITHYKVENTDKQQMYFSIGAHPGFICPLYNDESLNDYHLEFEHTENLERYLLENGCLNGQTESIGRNTRILELNEDQFAKDAIVLKNLQSEYLELKNRKGSYSLKMTFKDFPYFGIWKKPASPFLCLEPWCGIADNTEHNGELKSKEGINYLLAGETFGRSFSIEFNA
jgi:galactose mutarotase-like enzyme